MDKLAELAVQSGCAVVASVHQPRSTSFARSHDLMLLVPGGSTAYMGPTGASARRVVLPQLPVLQLGVPSPQELGLALSQQMRPQWRCCHVAYCTHPTPRCPKTLS